MVLVQLPEYYCTTFFVSRARQLSNFPKEDSRLGIVPDGPEVRSALTLHASPETMRIDGVIYGIPVACGAKSLAKAARRPLMMRQASDEVTRSRPTVLVLGGSNDITTSTRATQQQATADSD